MRVFARGKIGDTGPAMHGNRYKDSLFSVCVFYLFFT